MGLGVILWLLCLMGVEAFQTPNALATPAEARRTTVGLRSGAVAVSMADANMGRRTAILSYGALLSGFAVGEMPAFAAGADRNLDVAQQVKDGVKKICTGGSQPIPPDALNVGIVDDGSALIAGAKLGVAASGAKVVILKGSAEAVQDAYRQGDCQALVVPSVSVLKKVNSGQGLQCNGCSYGGGEAPPTWIIVMDGKGKTDQELQAESELTGRICSKDSPGVCFQLGQAVAVYSYELLPKLKIETAAERPPCTGRFEGIC